MNHPSTHHHCSKHVHQQPFGELVHREGFPNAADLEEPEQVDDVEELREPEEIADAEELGRHAEIGKASSLENAEWLVVADHSGHCTAERWAAEEEMVRNRIAAAVSDLEKPLEHTLQLVAYSVDE